MLNTRIRTIAVTAAAALSIGAATLAPTAAQAQWHTICVAGHCTTHTNFTIGGSDPCAGITSNYNKAYEALLEAIEEKKQQADKVHPEMTQAAAQAGIEEAEAQVHLASVAAFEWGCDVAARTSAPGKLGSSTAALTGHLRIAPSHHTRATTRAGSLSAK